MVNELCAALLRELRHGCGQRVSFAMKSTGGASRRGRFIEIDVQLATDDANFRRRFDTEGDAVAGDAADHDGDVVANDELLTDLAAKDEHGSDPP